MDGTTKQRWVDALRSGRYERGTYLFQFRDRYCALGVLCDVIGEPALVRRGEPLDPYAVDYDTAGTWGNWPAVEPLLERDDKWDIVRRNDGGYGTQGSHFYSGPPMPFDELADWIEQNVEVAA